MKEEEPSTKKGPSALLALARRDHLGAVLLEQVAIERIAGGRGSRGDAQFAIQRGGMAVDGARTDHQLLGDLPVGPALSEQAQDLHLPRRQAMGRRDRLVRWRTAS